MSINFGSPEEFVRNLNLLSAPEKQAQLSQALNSDRLDLVRAAINNTSAQSAENRSLALRASIETGKIDLAIHIIKLKGLSVEERQADLQLSAERGQVETVIALLKSGPVSNETIQGLLTYAVSSNNLAMLKAILNNAHIPELFIKQALFRACERGNHDAVKELLAPHGLWSIASSYMGYRAVSKEVRMEALLLACRNGQLPVVLELTKYKDIKSFWPDALNQAADNGHADVIGVLLSKGAVFSELAKQQAIIHAAQHGYTHVIHMLISHGSVISKRVVDQAIDQATANGHSETLQELLSVALINREQRGMAVKSAALNGHAEVIRVLLAGGLISEKDRAQAVHQAALGGHLSIIQLLLSNGPISLEDRLRAMNAARGRSQNDVLMALGAVSSSERVEAVIQAAQQGYADVIRSLLTNGPISDFNLGIAVGEAAKEGHLTAIEALLASGSISDFHRGMAVVAALQEGHLSIVQALLANDVRLSGEVLEIAVRTAATWGYLSVIQTLLANHASISESARGNSVFMAAARGHLPVIQALLANGPITEEYRARAIEVANYSNRNDMLTALGVVTGGATTTGYRPPDRLNVNREELAGNPVKYLKEVCQKGLLSVRFINPDGSEQAGFDAGGLSKQFIHELLEHLLVTKDIIQRSERFPVMGSDALEENYRNFGRLLTLIDQKNESRSDRIFTGPIFDKRTYGLLQIMLDPRMNDEQKDLTVAQALQDDRTRPLVEFAAKTHPTVAEITAIKEVLRAQSAAIGIDEDFSIKDSRELRECCLESFNGYIKALKAIASGITEPLKDKILESGEAYSLHIQGSDTPTIEQLKEKLHCANDSIKTQRDWILEKMQEELAKPDSTWIKRFLICVTGQSVLPVGRIILRNSSDSLIRAHTCSCTLDVPSDIDKARFFERLELTMASLDYGLT